VVAADVVYQDVVVYALFLGVLWVRPQGLMGTM
jgi:branched-subunit amino acid ABC-type transport system permease component